MILTDRRIRETCEAGDIVIDPFDADQVQSATYDLRVGGQGATASAKKLVNIKEEGYLSLAPGDFGVITVFEEIKLDAQHVARFGLRSKYARKGLIATTGPQIDPGFRGRLIIGITNLTPKSVSLPYKDDFVSVEFHKLEEPVTKPYDGPYQDRLELGPEEIEFITESEGMALSEVMTTLRSLSQNVGTLATDIAQLTAEVRAFKWNVPIIIALGLGIIGAIVALK